MSTPETVLIHILDKEYQVQCPPEEKPALEQSARELDKRMREIRKSGNVIGLERIAVMAALNLSYDLLTTTSEASTNATNQSELLRIDRKLFQALQQLEPSI